jgi:hypothetical protein
MLRKRWNSEGLSRDEMETDCTGIGGETFRCRRKKGWGQVLLTLYTIISEKYRIILKIISEWN